VPDGVPIDQAAEFGSAVLRASGAPSGGELLGYRLSEMSGMERAAAPGSAYQVLAQVIGSSASTSGSNPPQTMLFVGTWPDNPYPPLTVGPLAAAWDEVRASFAASRLVLLVVCFVFLGMTLVVSPVAFIVDRRMTERERVAAEMARVRRDAHDRVYNRMAALAMRLEAESAAASNPESSAALAAVSTELADTRRDLREILGDARAAATESATRAADPSGMLAEQLTALVAAQQSMTGARVELHLERDLPPMTPEAGWDLQCITEEAIANAIRHGNASEVTVSLAEDGDGVRLEIADNGGSAVPIDIDRLPISSTGLRGMRARAERLGGTLEVLSEETGVRVVVRVPERAGKRGR